MGEGGKVGTRTGTGWSANVMWEKVGRWEHERARDGPLITGARVGGGGRRCKEPDKGENGGGGIEDCARRARDFRNFGGQCCLIPPNWRK